MNFACEAVAMVHNGVFVIASVEHHTAGKDDEASEKYEQDFQAFFATIHKVTVKDLKVYHVSLKSVMNVTTVKSLFNELT